MLRETWNWVVRAAIAVCLMAGGAMLNDAHVEAQTVSEVLKKKTDKKVDDFFRKIDADGDDVVDQAELKKALGGEADGWLKNIDKNKDGKISRDEAGEYFKMTTREQELGEVTKKKLAEASAELEAFEEDLAVAIEALRVHHLPPKQRDPNPNP